MKKKTKQISRINKTFKFGTEMPAFKFGTEMPALKVGEEVHGLRTCGAILHACIVQKGRTQN